MFSGINGDVHINGSRLAGLSEWALNIDAAVVDSTFLGNTWTEIVGSVKNATGDISGYKDLDQENLYLVLRDGTFVNLNLYETEDTYWFLPNVLITNEQETVNVKGVVTLSYTFEVSGYARLQQNQSLELNNNGVLGVWNTAIDTLEVITV